MPRAAADRGPWLAGNPGLRPGVLSGAGCRMGEWNGQRPFVGALAMESPTDADDEVASWIAEGTPPIFFGFGSVPIGSPADTIAMIAAACTRLGERAIVGAGGTDFNNVPHFEHVKVVGQVNYATIFPPAARSYTTAAPAPSPRPAGGNPSIDSLDVARSAVFPAQLKRLKVGAGRRFSTTTEKSLVTDLRTDPRAAIHGTGSRDRPADHQTRRQRRGRRFILMKILPARSVLSDRRCRPFAKAS